MILTATLNPISIANLVVIGMLAGILSVIIVMALVVNSFTRLPGRGCARYWAGGLTLIFIGATVFMNHRSTADYLPGLLGFGGMLAGFILQWQGLRIFHLKTPGGHWPEIATIFLLVYALAMMNEFVYGIRFAIACLLSIAISALCIIDIIQFNSLRINKVMLTSIGGLSLLIVAACMAMINRVYAATDLATAVLSMRELVIDIIVPALGLVIYSAALVCLYFFRIAESTNYAASHDELTGLLNRRAINHYGQREVEVALRSHQPLSVAFVDIDFFKKINDQYGHDIGDMVLQEVSRMLSLTCRSVDLVGRYGGEEFCMVFAGGGSESDRGADGLGERLVAAIRDHVFPGVSGVTISVGLAVLPASARSASWFDLVQIADSELYKAKNGDRNRYSIQFLAEHSAESESAVRLKTPLHLSVATPGALPMRGH